MDFEYLKPSQVIKHLNLDITTRQLHTLENNPEFGEVLRDQSRTNSRIYSQNQIGKIAQQFSAMKLPIGFEGPLVYAVSQRKGGVGKTLISFFLGKQHAQHGIKTVVIGLDEQESITDLVKEFEIQSLSDLDAYNERKGLYDFIYNNEPIENIVIKSDRQENLWHIPETPELEDLDDNIHLKETVRTKVFKTRLIPALKKMGFEAIIFDCPPSLKSHLTKNALVASNHIIMPVACDMSSFRGFSKGLTKFSKFKDEETENGHIEWHNVFYLPTKVKKHGNGDTLSVQIHDQLKSEFGANVTNEIKFADIFEKANNEKLLPIEVKCNDNNAKALYEIIVDIFKKSVIHHAKPSTSARQ